MSTESELLADIRSAPCEDFRQSGRDMRATAAHLIAEGWTKPREVSTAAELDALPVGSVVLESCDYYPDTWTKIPYTGGGAWVLAGRDWLYSPDDIPLPATVLHEPGEGQ